MEHRRVREGKGLIQVDGEAMAELHKPTFRSFE